MSSWSRAPRAELLHRFGITLANVSLFIFPTLITGTRYGVYTGIINVMIVIPMLIQTVTFGPIFKNLLGDDPNNAITFAAVLLACAVAAMLWIKEPPIVRDVDDILAMPVGGGR